MRMGRSERILSDLRLQRRAVIAGLAALLAALLSFPLVTPARAAGEQIGPVTGLKLPRYASLRYDKTNVRIGPTKNHDTAFIFQRAGLPVEIIAESDTWRRIRDAEGGEGWVLASLLSGRRTALVAPWRRNETLSLHAKPIAGEVVARLQSGVLANVKSCANGWCRIFGDGFDGFIRQSDLWGVYPDEPL